MARYNQTMTGSVFLALILMMLAGATAGAQTLAGSIVGSVVDGSATSVRGARVTVTKGESNFTCAAETNEYGAFSIPGLPSGIYCVRVEKSGFATVDRSGVAASINGVTRADLRLEIHGVTGRVTVDAQTPVLQTDLAETRAELATGPPESSNSIPSNPLRELTFTVTAYVPAIESIETVNVVTAASMPSRRSPAAPR